MKAKLTLPICAKCNKPVDYMYESYDPCNRRKEFIVKCHGEIERTDINDEILEDMISIKPGLAFNKKLLSHDTPTTL